MSSIYYTAIELLLSSMSSVVGEDGMEHSFFYKRPNRPGSATMGVRLYKSNVGMTKTALFVRKHGPPYLSSLSISAIQSLLSDFVVDNFYIISGETFALRIETNYTDYVSEKSKVELAENLKKSEIFSPKSYWHIFPLSTVTVAQSFSCGSFFYSSPGELALQIPESSVWLEATTFPPLKEGTFRRDLVQSWLGVQSPLRESAIKSRAVILGCLALTMELPRRRMFSGRKLAGGICSLQGGPTISFGKPHTPAIFDNLELLKEDQPWLAQLGELLEDQSKLAKRKCKALEYYYRSWPLNPSERFPILCMALDAIYGEVSNSTQAVISGVMNTLNQKVDDSRLSELMEIRASVIHGGAPDVYDSRKYAKYFEKYISDPINDLDDLVYACLRQRLFSAEIRNQVDPNKVDLSALEKAGRLPRNLRRGILAS